METYINLITLATFSIAKTVLSRLSKESSGKQTFVNSRIILLFFVCSCIKSRLHFYDVEKFVL